MYSQEPSQEPLLLWEGEGGHSRLKKGWHLSQQNVLEAAWHVGGESPRAYFKEDCEGDEAWQERRLLQNITSLEVGDACCQALP